MAYTEEDVQEILKALASLCKDFQESDVNDYVYFWNQGFIYGVLAAIKREVKDLCAVCEGCKYPVYPPKSYYEKR